jgi:hypothetical protein
LVLFGGACFFIFLFERLDDDVVYADGLHLFQNLLLCAGAYRKHGDDGRHTKDDAQRGEQGAQLIDKN